MVLGMSTPSTIVRTSVFSSSSLMHLLQPLQCVPCQLCKRKYPNWRAADIGACSRSSNRCPGMLSPVHTAPLASPLSPPPLVLTDPCFYYYGPTLGYQLRSRKGQKGHHFFLNHSIKGLSYHFPRPHPKEVTANCLLLHPLNNPQ